MVKLLSKINKKGRLFEAYHSMSRLSTDDMRVQLGA